MDAYVPLLVYLPLALVIPLAISFLAAKINSRDQGSADPARTMPYESGHPTPPLDGRFPVKFYLVAMLFVLFELLAATFIPWAVLLKQLGAFGLWVMMIFAFVLGIGYAYAWKRGGFQWR